MGLKQALFLRKLNQELSLKGGIVKVDETSCDGCGDCVETCPHSAIHIKTLSEEEIKRLPFKGRLKVKIKGSKKAFINPEICTACGLCMKRCHELAIHKLKQ